MYTVVNKLTPNWILYCVTVGEVVQVATRQFDNLFVGRTRTDIGKKRNVN